MAHPIVRGSVAVIGDWEDGVGATLLKDVDFADEGCWLRTTGIDSKWGTSRGDFRGVKGESAHRVAHELWIGFLGKDQRVTQLCGQRNCINPSHLAIAGSEESDQWRLLKGLEREGACHVWTGYRMPSGHGQMRLGKEAVLTHRYAWEVKYGPIPEGMEVCHHCDNPPCCKISHLFIGPHERNMADMAVKGRTAKAVLHPDQVLDIRNRYAAGKIGASALAREFGVTKRAIQLIVRGKNWQHVGGPITNQRKKRW